jgi:hypothetical protein
VKRFWAWLHGGPDISLRLFLFSFMSLFLLNTFEKMLIGSMKSGRLSLFHVETLIRFAPKVERSYKSLKTILQEILGRCRLFNAMTR